MIEVRGLKKSFGDNEVLKGVDLSVDKGDVVVILGPSGSGKTTILRCINFLEKASEGTMEFDGETFDLSSMNHRDIHRLRMKTAFVFQNYNLFANMTVLRNVEIGLTAARGIGKQEAEETALKMLKKVGLADKKDAYPSQLSGGQQQRVAIARALASNPEVIYFDEPTSALDPEMVGEVLQVMKAIAKSGTTMIIVTHEIGFAKEVADRIVFLENGELIADMLPEEVNRSYPNQRVASFLKQIL